jgi:Concanavalin A-like lectin/glucanases superfamily
MPINKPVISSFQYESDAGSDQMVCSVTGTGGLQATNQTLFPVSSGTVCVWFNTTSVVATSVLFEYLPPVQGAQPFIVKNPTNLEVLFGTNTSGPTGVSINTGTWHQLAVEFERLDASSYSVAVYIDGTLLFQTSGLVSINTLAAGGTFYLGWGGTAATAIVSLVSELQVWNRKLTANEIATGVLRRAVDGTPGLILHWPLNILPVGITGPTIVQSNIRFRTGTTNVAWGAVAAATSYEIVAGSSDGVWNYSAKDITTLTTNIPSTPLNKKLGVKVRAYQSATAGPWSDLSEINAFELGQTAVSSVWDNAAKTLTANWNDIPQRTSFTLNLFQDSSTTPQFTPNYATTSYSLTSKIDDTSSWLLDVSAFSAGSLGPFEASIPRTAPTLSILYLSATNQLNCSWVSAATASDPPVQYNRLSIVPTDGSTPFSEMLAGNTNQASVTNTQYPLSPTKTYTIKLRQIGQGAIGTWATQTLTPHVVTAPVMTWSYISASDTLNAT